MTLTHEVPGADRPGHRLTGLVHRDADWFGLSVLVTGLGMSGFAAADALLQRGARVSVVDSRDGSTEQERAEILRMMGGNVSLGDHITNGNSLPSLLSPAQRSTGSSASESGLDLVVTSPGWRPDHPLLVAAGQAGVPIWGEVELAWRMRSLHGAADWLTLTGTNGKTTTVRMLTAMLQAAGMRAVAVGNVGTPVLHAVLDTDHSFDVLAVELSSFQLHWLASDRARSLAPLASALLNVAPDHLDWHGSLAAYALDKQEVYQRTRQICAYNVQDPETEALLRAADVAEGCRAVGFTRGVPDVGMVGVVDDVLADRAFVEQRQTSAAELGTLADIQGDGSFLPPHQISNALAAATLARAAGVSPSAVRDGLRGFRPDPHRIALVDTVDGVQFIDDSKATNPPAAAASLVAFHHVVWIAGGLLKGADIDDVVRQHARRLRGVVLIGQDRAVIAAAISRHAPDVPVVEVVSTQTRAVTTRTGVAPHPIHDLSNQVMDDVVRSAASLAHPGDAVLLAPAAASMDMFTDYAQRGDLFAAAVRRFAGVRRGGVR